MNNRIMMTLLIMLCFAMTSAAQTKLDSAGEKIRSEAVLNQIKNDLSTPSGHAALSNFISSINISSSFTEGANGRIDLQTKLKSGWTGGLSLEQKIGKSDEEAIPFSLSGLGNGTTLQFNLQKMFWNPGFDAISIDQIQQLNEVEKAYAKRNDIADYRTIGLRDISENGTEEEKRMALEAMRTAFKTPMFLNARLGFTKTGYNFTTDSVNLFSNSESHITPSLSVSLIKTIASDFKVTGYFSVSYHFSVYHQAGKAYNFTVPFGNTGNFYSRTLTFGKPVKRTDNALSMEYRRNLISNNKDAHFHLALSPSVNLSIDSRMIGLFLPVYFIPSTGSVKKLPNNLSAGIRLGYISSTEKLVSFRNGLESQLIISAPLDFLNIL